MTGPAKHEYICHLCDPPWPLAPSLIVLTAQHWSIQHARHTSQPGWFLVILHRHCEALHDLSDEEWVELGVLLPRLCSAIHKACGSVKEYVAQFAEGAAFQHVHFHVIARATEWSSSLRSAHVFTALGEAAPNRLPIHELARVADSVRLVLSSPM